MNAGKDIRLVAMADIFDERLTTSREQLKNARPGQFAVDDDHCFVGFDASERLLAIGEIVAIQENYFGRPSIVRERRHGQTEMEYHRRANSLLLRTNDPVGRPDELETLFLPA